MRRCPVCGGKNFKYQVVSEKVLTSDKRRFGIIGWLLFFPLILFVKAIKMFFNLMLLFISFPLYVLSKLRGEKYRYRTIYKSMEVCQDCGHIRKV